MNVVFLLNNTQEYENFYFHHNSFESLMQGLVVHKTKTFLEKYISYGFE